MKKTSKGKTIFFISLLSFLVLLLLGFMISVILGWVPIRMFPFSSWKVSKHLAYEEVYDVNFQNIKVDVSVGDIEILPSNDQKIHVLVYSDNELFDVEKTTSDFSVIFEEEEGFHFSFSGTKDLVKIYVPSDNKISFTLISDFGDIEVKDFCNANVDVTANMGDISIQQANLVKAENDMGNVTIGSVNDLFVSQDMGDLKVDFVTSRLSIENDMGNIFLKEVVLKYNSKITSNSGDVEIEKISDVYVDVSVDLGDVDIANNNRKATTTLTIKSDLGDITVG